MFGYQRRGDWRTIPGMCRRLAPTLLLFAWSLGGLRMLSPNVGVRPLRHAAVGALIGAAEPLDDHFAHRRSTPAVLAGGHGPQSALLLRPTAMVLRAPAPAAAWPIARHLKIPPPTGDGTLPS